MIKRPLVALLLGLLAACAELPGPQPAVPVPPGPHLVLAPSPFRNLSGWRTDHHSQALVAFLKSCARLELQPPERFLDNLGAATEIRKTGLAGQIRDWLPICEAAAEVPPQDGSLVREFFEAWFTPFQVTNNGGPDGLITGYYEAKLTGSRRRHGPYRYPIYGPPGDLVTADLGRFRPEWRGKALTGRVENGRFVPYHTRAEIKQGALSGKARPILWVDDPIDSFVLHIQGSGRVELDDGSVVHMGFAGRNGHSYRSVGRELIKRGALDKHSASMQGIRAWIKANPEEGAQLLDINPSYIFFKHRNDSDGPVGAQGVPLTPGRSLAVDRVFIPYGVPVWLATTEPLSEKPLRRLMVAQDTGGAIKGPVRGDFFWGYGETAAANAGRMKQTGQLWLLLPRGVAGWDLRQAKGL